MEAIPGHTTQGQPLRVPHIGWAPLYPAQQREGFLGSTLEAIPTKSQVYFVHGYRAMPARQADRLADTLYGLSLIHISGVPLPCMRRMI